MYDILVIGVMNVEGSRQTRGPSTPGITGPLAQLFILHRHVVKANFVTNCRDAKCGLHGR